MQACSKTGLGCWIVVPCFGEKISDLGLAAALQLTTTVLYYTISYYNYYTIRYYTIVLTTTEPPKLYTTLRSTADSFEGDVSSFPSSSVGVFGV